MLTFGVVLAISLRNYINFLCTLSDMFTILITFSLQQSKISNIYNYEKIVHRLILSEPVVSHENDLKQSLCISKKNRLQNEKNNKKYLWNTLCRYEMQYPFNSLCTVIFLVRRFLTLASSLKNNNKNLHKKIRYLIEGIKT